jgi:hypothetical protein
MLSRLKALLGRITFPSLQRGDYTTESRQPIENTDALAAAGERASDPTGGPGWDFPPNYVPPADEGRPRH